MQIAQQRNHSEAPIAFDLSKFILNYGFNSCHREAIQLLFVGVISAGYWLFSPNPFRRTTDPLAISQCSHISPLCSPPAFRRQPPIGRRSGGSRARAAHAAPDARLRVARASRAASGGAAR